MYITYIYASNVEVAVVSFFPVKDQGIPINNINGSIVIWNKTPQDIIVGNSGSYTRTMRLVGSIENLSPNTNYEIHFIEKYIDVDKVEYDRIMTRGDGIPSIISLFSSDGVGVITFDELIINHFSLHGEFSIVGFQMVIREEESEENLAIGIIGVPDLANIVSETEGDISLIDDNQAAGKSSDIVLCDLNRFSSDSAFDNSNGQITLELDRTTLYVKINVNIQGLTPGFATSLILFEYGDLRNPSISVGQHWNPTNSLHGSHYGDLGNFIADIDGNIITSFDNHNLELFGFDNIVGKSLGLMTNPDDGSQPNGNVGDIGMACTLELESLLETSLPPLGLWVMSLLGTLLTCVIIVLAMWFYMQWKLDWPALHNEYRDGIELRPWQLMGMSDEQIMAKYPDLRPVMPDDVGDDKEDNVLGELNDDVQIIEDDTHSDQSNDSEDELGMEYAQKNIRILRVSRENSAVFDNEFVEQEISMGTVFQSKV